MSSSLSSRFSIQFFDTASLSPVRLLSLIPTLLLISSFPQSTHAASSAQEVFKKDGSTADESRGWAPFEQIPVQCLNRTIDTGEHVTQENGELQYIPFWTCNETGRPLELAFGSEKDVNCTIAEVDDAFFHILEFYIHNDAPLSCRVPSLPPSSSSGKPGGTAVEYTHLQIALTGMLQMSHLHINPQLNILLHTTETGSTGKDKDKKATSSAAEEADAKKKKKQLPKSKGKNSKYLALAEEGQIIASTAYSLPPTTSSPKLVIGDPLPLTFRVRWYSTAVLPPSTSRIVPPRAGLGGHVHLSTAAYCVLSFGAGLAVSIAYFRGVDMPRRLRRYGAEKLGGGGEGRGGAGGGYGYAYVPGGFSGGGGGYSGKRD